MLVLAPVSRASWTVTKWCGRGFEVTRLATPSKLSLVFRTSHQKTNACGPPDDHWKTAFVWLQLTTLKSLKPGSWRMWSLTVVLMIRFDRIEAPSTLSAFRLSTLADESTVMGAPPAVWMASAGPPASDSA